MTSKNLLFYELTLLNFFIAGMCDTMETEDQVDLQPKNMEESVSYLDNFLKTPGLIHLAEKILWHSNSETLASFRLVSKASKE